MRGINPFDVLFWFLLSFTLLVWVLRGFELLGYMPGMVLWVLIFATISAGVLARLSRSQRR